MSRTTMAWICGAILIALVNTAYCYAMTCSKSVALLGVVFLTIVIVGYAVFSLISSKHKLGVEILFAGGVFVLGLMYMLVFPPTVVPDGFYHYECAYKMSDSLLFLPTSADTILVRGDDASLMESVSYALNYDTYRRFIESFSLFAQDPELQEWTTYSAYDIGQNPPQIKIAAAVGIALARLLGLGALLTYYSGVFFNLLFFVVLVYLSVRFTPIGKRVMMASALLPMTLHLVGSYSYDAGIIGLAYLLTALLLKAIYGTGRLGVKEVASITAVAFLLAPCKVVYSAIALLLLFVPKERFSSRKKSICFKVGVLVLMGASIVALRLPMMLDFAGVAPSDGLDYRGEESGVFYTLRDFFENPGAMFLLFVRTLASSGDMYLLTLLGGSLGFFQGEIASSWHFILVFAAILGFALLRTKNEILLSAKMRAVFAAIGIAVCLMIMLSMCLGWTFNTEVVIQGVQGRYFIPVLPLLMMAAQGGAVTASRDYTKIILGLMALFNVMYLTRIFSAAFVL